MKNLLNKSFGPFKFLAVMASITILGLVLPLGEQAIASQYQNFIENDNKLSFKDSNLKKAEKTSTMIKGWMNESNQYVQTKLEHPFLQKSKKLITKTFHPHVRWLADQMKSISEYSFISDGSSVVLEDIGIGVTPPLNWQVKTHSWSNEVVMNSPSSLNKIKIVINPTETGTATPVAKNKIQRVFSLHIKDFLKDQGASRIKISRALRVPYRNNADGIAFQTSYKKGESRFQDLWFLATGQDYRIFLQYQNQITKTSPAQSEQDLIKKSLQTIAPIELRNLFPWFSFFNLFVIVSISLLLFYIAWTKLTGKSGNFVEEEDDQESSWENHDFFAPPTKKQVLPKASVRVKPKPARIKPKHGQYDFILKNGNLSTSPKRNPL